MTSQERSKKQTRQAMIAAVLYADTRAVSRAAYPHACIEDRKLRDLIDVALGRIPPIDEPSASARSRQEEIDEHHRADASGYSRADEDWFFDSDGRP